MREARKNSNSLILQWHIYAKGGGKTQKKSDLLRWFYIFEASEKPSDFYSFIFYNTNHLSMV